MGLCIRVVNLLMALKLLWGKVLFGLDDCFSAHLGSGSTIAGSSIAAISNNSSKLGFHGQGWDYITNDEKQSGNISIKI